LGRSFEFEMNDTHRSQPSLFLLTDPVLSQSQYNSW